MNALVTILLSLAIGPLLVYSKLEGEWKFCAELEDVTEEMLNNDSDESIKCFYLCYFEQTDVIKNGKIIQPDSSNKKRSHSVRKIAGSQRTRKCLDLKDDNECELAYKLFKCLKRNITDGQVENFLRNK
ncbi:general odorant-binding protein 56a-like [Drosophila rhopaloa]|uniref:General odorant-binding protein 56a-like n=1 Tax=Drosophila rhopaloa TaxID=1041015 RepID=A0A6P4E7K8_DRORH|nr:general odorant-binding protein 56a-like [Drosophila rhopaloa]